MALVLFHISVGLLIYVYLGYIAILYILSLFRNQKNDRPVNHEQLSVSIIIAAFNEEQNVRKRIENLAALNYPQEKIEIIIASDGSTDRTVEIARNVKQRNVRVIDFEKNRGRAITHSHSVSRATGQIILFTDMETKFHEDFVSQIVAAFSKTVGIAVGEMVYTTSTDDISHSEGLYWKFEKKLKVLEQTNGLLFKTSGACMAVRKNLWKNLESTDDCDFVTPLDVILQGYKVAYVSTAIAFDKPADSIKSVFKTRIRQSSKSFSGTIRRWGLKNCVKHPAISWAIVSHKILRWMTFYFMLTAITSNYFLLTENTFYASCFYGQLLLYAGIVIAGTVELITKKRIPVLSSLFAFCIASIAFAIGLTKAILGKAAPAYN